MTVYLIAIFLTAIISIEGNKQRICVVKKDGKEVYSWSNIYTIAILLVWCSVFAFRGISIGSDTPGYHHYYTEIVRNNISYDVFIEGQRDLLFASLEYVCAKIFNGNWICFQFVVALITYLPVINVIKKNSPHVIASFLFFIFTFQFYSGFNGMRQGIATSFVMYAYYNFLLEKKYVKYVILSVIAFGFHSSVLLATPFLFMSLRGLKSIIVKWSSIVLVLLFVFINQFWPMIINFLMSVGQTKMAYDYAELPIGAGSGALRLLVSMAPFILGYLFRDGLREKYDKFDNELVLALYSGIFMLLSMRYWIFARVSSYFSLGLTLLLPKFKDVFFQKQLGLSILIILYFAYMVVMLLHGEGGYYPYTFYF